MEKVKALNFQGLFIKTYVSDVIIGGAERDRTVDLRVANASLSQLSYSPETA
jgi:hypothetical protein